MILGKSLNHVLLSASWSLSRGRALFFDGQEENRLPGIHQFLVTAVREASLLSFLYFTFCVSCLVCTVRQVGSAELRTNSS